MVTIVAISHDSEKWMRIPSSLKTFITGGRPPTSESSDFNTLGCGLCNVFTMPPLWKDRPLFCSAQSRSAIDLVGASMCIAPIQRRSIYGKWEITSRWWTWKTEDIRLSYFHRLQFTFHRSKLNTRIDITSVTLKNFIRLRTSGWMIDGLTSTNSVNSFLRNPFLVLVSSANSLESIAILASVAAFINNAKAFLRSPFFFPSCSFAESIWARAVLIRNWKEEKSLTEPCSLQRGSWIWPSSWASWIKNLILWNIVDSGTDAFQALRLRYVLT